MGWREELRRVDHANGSGVGATFRGVPFRTTDSDTGIGRRNEVHEYPERDIPYADDLGRRARTFRVDGYVVGENYLQERDALIEALEAYGPGELVHPRYGMLNVAVVGQVSIRESHSEGGIARFSILFTEAGENTFPQAASSTQDGVHDAADALDESAVDRLESMLDVSGAAALVSDVVGRVTSTLNTIQRIVSLNGIVGLAGDIVNGVSSISDRISSLIRTPQNLALQFKSLFQQLSRAIKRPKSALADLRSEYGSNDRAPWAASAGAPVTPVQPLGSTAARREVNAAVMQEFVRSQVISTQARILTDAIEAEDIVTAQDALDQAEVILEEIDHELEAYDPPPAMSAALIRLRVAIVRDVSEQADRLAHRSVFTTQALLPALAIAQRVYQDGTRADELVERNQVRHPMFVPAGQLEVLR